MIIIIGIISIIITIIIIMIIIIITIIILIVFWNTYPNTSLAMQTSQKETNLQKAEEWQLRYWCKQGDSAQNHRHDHQLVMMIKNIRIHIKIITSIAISMKSAITRPLLKRNNNNNNENNETNNASCAWRWKQMRQNAKIPQKQHAMEWKYIWNAGEQ